MIKIDVDYTDYRIDDDPNYPGGKAVDTTTEDSIDGTPYKARWMNDINGFRQALYIEAFGSLDSINNEPDHANESDSVKAIKKILSEKVDKTDLIGQIPKQPFASWFEDINNIIEPGIYGIDPTFMNNCPNEAGNSEAIIRVYKTGYIILQEYITRFGSFLRQQYFNSYDMLVWSDWMVLNGHPIGSYYTQYPLKNEQTMAFMFSELESPAVLLGGTWTIMFESGYDSNLYFRTGPDLGVHRGQAWSDANKNYSSSEADGAVAGVEPDAIRNIVGRFGGAFEPDNSYQGPFSIGTSYTGTAAASGGSSDSYVNFDASKAVPTDETNHPKNRLIRVWKRIA